MYEFGHHFLITEMTGLRNPAIKNGFRLQSFIQSRCAISSLLNFVNYRVKKFVNESQDAVD
jgi:hypothetical protein